MSKAVTSNNKQRPNTSVVRSIKNVRNKFDTDEMVKI